MEGQLEARLRNLTTLSDAEALRNDIRKNRDELVSYDVDKLEAGLDAAVSRLRTKPRRFKFSHNPSSQPTHSESGNAHKPFTASENQATRSCNEVKLILEAKPSLTIANLSNSLVIATNVQGPVYISNVVDCLLVFNCQQCRIHDSHNDVIAPGCPEPIIENSDELEIVDTNLGGKFGSVRDFSWPRSDMKSPNWKKGTDLVIRDIQVLGSKFQDALQRGSSILPLINEILVERGQ